MIQCFFALPVLGLLDPVSTQQNASNSLVNHRGANEIGHTAESKMHRLLDPGTALLGLCPPAINAQVHRWVCEGVHSGIVGNPWKTHATYMSIPSG